jgi:hypothetical protein
MPCGCKQTKPDLGTKPGVVYGANGLDLITCTAAEPYKRIGDYTGYVYPFQVRRSMYVDRRDTVYIIGQDFTLEAE